MLTGGPLPPLCVLLKMIKTTEQIRRAFPYRIDEPNEKWLRVDTEIKFLEEIQEDLQEWTGKVNKKIKNRILELKNGKTIQ